MFCFVFPGKKLLLKSKSKTLEVSSILSTVALRCCDFLEPASLEAGLAERLSLGWKQTRYESKMSHLEPNGEVTTQRA